MSVYGIETWTRRADAFGVYFNLFSKLAPLHWRDRDAVPCARRSPARRTLDADARHGRAAVHHDRHDELRRLLPGPALDRHERDRADAPQRFANLGFSQETALEITFTIGLLFMVCFVGGDLPRSAIAGMRSIGGRHDQRRAGAARSCTR